MSTRSTKECQDLAKAWLAGKKKKVVDELGGEPTERFLWDFGNWRGDPRKVYTAANRLVGAPDAASFNETFLAEVDDHPATKNAGKIIADMITPAKPKPRK